MHNVVRQHLLFSLDSYSVEILEMGSFTKYQNSLFSFQPMSDGSGVLLRPSFPSCRECFDMKGRTAQVPIRSFVRRRQRPRAADSPSQSFRDGNYPSAVEERYIKGFGGRDQLHYADQFALNHAGYSRNLVQVISSTLVCRVI